MLPLLVLATQAGEPLEPLPPRPAPSTPLAGECSRAIGLDLGQPVPEALVSAGKVACAAVAVPLSDAADHLALRSWSDAVEARYRLDVVYLEGQVRIAEAERDWYKARREEESALWERPWVQRCVGGTSVLLVVGITAWGLGQVDL